MRLFGATNKVLNLNKYHEVQYGDQSLCIKNTLSLSIYKTPSLLATKSSNNPSLGSKFLYKILYASQTNDEFLQISPLRQSLSIKGSLSFLTAILFTRQSFYIFKLLLRHVTLNTTKHKGSWRKYKPRRRLFTHCALWQQVLSLALCWTSLVTWPRPYGGQARLSVFTRHML